MLRAINNARVVTPEGVVEGASVVLEGGRVAGVSRRSEKAGDVLDAGGRYVLPGMVDLHTDAIEKQISPRPGVEFPGELAFLEMDRLFAASGITTGFHAVSFMEGWGRSTDGGRGIVDLVVHCREEALVRHELHLRCELPQEANVGAIVEMLERQVAKVVSVMDHTPGQGQFRDLEWYRRYRREHAGATDEQVATAIAEAERRDGSEVEGRMDRVANFAREHDVVFASHDDDTPERVEMLAEKGARISEFPVNAEAALRAKELGLSVCLGAPNVVRGASSGGNLNATEAVSLGLVDALCSDYHPPSMLPAAFRLARDKVLPLHKAIGLVSVGPGRAAGLSERGEIRGGAVADLILVGEHLRMPVVTYAIVDGEERYAARAASQAQ